MWNITIEDQSEIIVDLREIVQLLSAFGGKENLSYLVHSHQGEQGFHILHSTIIQDGLHQKAVTDVFLFRFRCVPKQGCMIGYILFSRCHAAKIRKNNERNYEEHFFITFAA